MPKTDTHALTVLIQRSLLLDDTRKEALYQALPRLQPKELQELESLLTQEAVLIQEAAGRTVHKVAEEENISALESLNQFFGTASRKLRKAEEEAETESDAEDLDTFFDGVT